MWTNPSKPEKGSGDDEEYAGGRSRENSPGAMASGDNCCEAVLLAAEGVFQLKLPQEIMAAGRYFREGMDSGCTCGALVGMMMVSGILAQKGLPSPDLARDLTRQFKAEFGSTCCRVICQKRPLLERIGKKGCIALTGRAAELLVKTWQGVEDDAGRDLSYYTDAQ